ncbi:hypothetical protein B0H19DRAFT_1106000 [Mycena capillaripes]|nr:hypothetical protein B0H19DRAFT_1106000 [Mycena capillaripes]
MPGKRTRSDPFKLFVDSPFFVLFEQDRVPSSQQKQMIQQLLAEKTAHLAHLNSKVPKRKTKKKIPRELRAELDHTRRSIKFHRALISPWRRLPVEIMAEIFLFALEVTIQPDDADNSWNDDREGTLLLCKICSNWRSIAINTSALWNVLSINLHYVRRPLDWISTWLDRSRSMPVYLQIFWGHKALPDVINPVLSAFAAHLHHIAGLWIDGLDIENSELIDDAYPQPTFPPVKSPSSFAPLLSIVGVDLPPGTAWDWIHAACRASPCLTHLTASQFSLDWPVTNLTKLHLFDAVPMFKVFQILEQAPNLENISLDVDGPAVTSSTGNVLVMKSVSRIEVTSSDHLGQFLEQVALPGLVDFAIHQIVNWPEAEFISFLSRSACALRSLHFYDVQISQEQLIACLRYKAFNTLESLFVWECDPPASALLQYLTYHGHPFPNPSLKAIELGNIHATDGLLSTLVESRLSTATGLPSGVPTPALLNRIQFSFVDGAFASENFTHVEDWKRLREIERTSRDTRLELVWPDSDLEQPS